MNSPKKTWLNRFAEKWTEAYMGQPSYGQLGKYLKPLVEQHGEDDVFFAWEKYINTTDGRYASPAKFSQTFGSWWRAPTGAYKRPPKYTPDGRTPKPKPLWEIFQGYK